MILHDIVAQLPSSNELFQGKRPIKVTCTSPRLIRFFKYSKFKDDQRFRELKQLRSVCCSLRWEGGEPQGDDPLVSVQKTFRDTTAYKRSLIEVIDE